MSKDANLSELEKLESAAKSDNVVPFENNSENFETPNMLDGYRIIERDELPQNGVLYPESWQFAYRCPTSKEVANFSTINEEDRPAIVTTIEDLINKCVVIYDSEREVTIPSNEINDAHRIFFLLKLRDFYLPGSPIKYTSVCTMCHEPFDVNLTAESLKFPNLSAKLLEDFDGRKFTLTFPGQDEPFVFLVPTIKNTSKLFKYIVKSFRDEQNNRDEKDSKLIYDKQFLLFAPFLFETGKETIQEISYKYKALQKNDARFKIYLEIITKLKLDNFDYLNIECSNCGSMEEAQIKFPGGWKNMFIGVTSSNGYFD